MKIVINYYQPYIKDINIKDIKDISINNINIS